jgi:VanZ family protein
LVVWRLVLLAAIVVTLVGALTPPNDHPLQLVSWEKGNHILAFLVLAGTAAAAFPGVRLFVIGAVLIGFGAAIELLQALPAVSRDPEVMDVGWDAIGAFVALGVIALFRRRRSRV